MKYFIILVGLLITTNIFSQEDVNQEFIEWVQDNNLEETKNYLAKGANINYVDDDGQNAAFYAIENEEEGIEIFHFLLSKNIDVKAVNNENENLLHFAASNENPTVVDTLITLGVDINAQDEDGFTPIMRAAKEDNFDIVHKLAVKNADLSITDEDEETILNKMDLEEADWDKLITYNWTQKQLDYLLYYRVYELESIDMIEPLINEGANVNSSYEEVPLSIIAADILDNASIIKLLLEKGMNPNAVDEDDQNALWHANTVEILNLYIAKGADVNKKDTEGFSVLHDHVHWGHVDFVKALIDGGADVNITSPSGTPLKYSKTLKELPNKNISYKTEELKQSHLDDYLNRIKTIQKLLKANGAK